MNEILKKQWLTSQKNKDTIDAYYSSIPKEIVQIVRECIQLYTLPNNPSCILFFSLKDQAFDLVFIDHLQLSYNKKKV